MGSILYGSVWCLLQCFFTRSLTQHLYTWIEPLKPNQLSQAKLADTERALQTEQNTRIEEQQRYEQHGMALGGDSDAENLWEMNKQKWEYFWNIYILRVITHV